MIGDPTNENEIPESAICGNCDGPCTVICEDQGIGNYEYAGQYCTHVDFQLVTDCCGSEEWEADDVA